MNYKIDKKYFKEINEKGKLITTLGPTNINHNYLMVTWGKYRNKYLHRLIWEIENGKIPKDHHIHHKNGDKLDNRLENLELIHKSKHNTLHKKGIEPKKATKKAAEVNKKNYWHLSKYGFRDGKQVYALWDNESNYFKKSTDKKMLEQKAEEMNKKLNLEV